MDNLIEKIDTSFVDEFKIENLTNIVNDNIKDLEEDLTNNQNIDFTDNVSESKMIPISDSEGQDITKKNPNRLKIDELRELVVNKNLISNEDSLKLKKAELLKLLD